VTRVSVDVGFLADLERCARRIYELHEELRERRSRRALDLLFDQDRRVVIALTGQLLASIALIPWLGPWILIAGLVVLYVGAFASAAWTVSRMPHTRTTERRDRIEQAVRQATRTCPGLDAGARALLIRLANLAAIPPTTTSLSLLRATLRDAMARPELRSWPFLGDVAALVDGQNGRLLVAPPGS
jgi:hypothetical protein